jgi:hypothetical protein
MKALHKGMLALAGFAESTWASCRFREHYARLSLPSTLLSLSHAVLLCSDVQGSSVLAQLVKQAGGRISIMAAGGVRSANAAALLQATGVCELHSSAKRWVGLVLQCFVTETIHWVGCQSEYVWRGQPAHSSGGQQSGT